MDGIRLEKRCLAIAPAQSILLFFVLAGLIAFLPGTSRAAVMSSGNYRMVADVLSGGGGDIASDNYVIRHTIGQPSAIGPSESSSFSNYAGFWYSAIFADMKKSPLLGPMLLLLLDDNPSQ